MTTPDTSMTAIVATLCKQLGIQPPSEPPEELPLVTRRRARPASAFAADAADRMRSVVPAAFRECVDVAVAAPRMRFPVEGVIETARRLFEGTVTHVVFRGQSADGKTTGAALLVGELARLVEAHFAQHGRDPIGRTLPWWENALAWCSAHELAEEADDVRDGDAPTARRARTAPILVLDDLGNEKGRFPGSNNVPPGVIQTRYDAGLSYVVTTGLAYKSLEANYSSAVARRLWDARTVLLGLKAGAQ